MGMDFVALVRFHRTREAVRATNALENDTRPISAEVQALWREQRFAPFHWDRTTWVSHEGYRHRQVKRPRGPDLSVALRTVDGFWLTFGRGACCISHSLRWYIFLTDPLWQQAMLGACDRLADMLEAADGAVMSDFHPSCLAFFAGSGYDACLRAAPPIEGEVPAISDLARVVDSDGTLDPHGYWCFRRDWSPVPHPANRGAEPAWEGP